MTPNLPPSTFRTLWICVTMPCNYCIPRSVIFIDTIVFLIEYICWGPRMAPNLLQYPSKWWKYCRCSYSCFVHPNIPLWSQYKFLEFITSLFFIGHKILSRGIKGMTKYMVRVPKIGASFFHVFWGGMSYVCDKFHNSCRKWIILSPVCSTI